jgi:hypothetical protein
MNKQNEMVVVERKPGALARPILPTINIEELITKAVDSKAAVEVVKELRAMLREDQAIAAAQAFDEAMSAFQAQCPVIIKGRGVPDRSGATAYKYAPIEKIEEVIRPIEREHGFTHTYNQDVASQPGWVITSVTITHTLGHSKTSVGKFPLGTRTAIMSDTQQYAAALTFSNRRVLGNAYGLVFAGEDKDGGNPPKASATGRVVTTLKSPRTFTRRFCNGRLMNLSLCRMAQWMICPTPSFRPPRESLKSSARKLRRTNEKYEPMANTQNAT